MTRYPLTLRDKLRFRFGLQWASSLPTLSEVKRIANGLLLAAALLACIGYTHTQQYAEEMEQEAMAQAHSNRALTKALVTCISATSNVYDEPMTTYPEKI